MLMLTLSFLFVLPGHFLGDGLVDSQAGGRVENLSHEGGVQSECSSIYPR